MGTIAKISLFLFLSSCSLLPEKKVVQAEPIPPVDLMSVGYSDSKYREVEALIEQDLLRQYPPVDEFRITGSDGKTRIYDPKVVMDRMIELLGKPILVK